MSADVLISLLDPAAYSSQLQFSNGFWLIVFGASELKNESINMLISACIHVLESWNYDICDFHRCFTREFFKIGFEIRRIFG